VRDVVIAHTFQTLQSERTMIDKELRRMAQRHLTSYGVKVYGLNLKGLAPAQLIHIVSDTPQAPVLLQSNQEAT
jgi:hypothetical protein